MHLKASQIFETFHAQGILEQMSGPDTAIARFDPVENGTASSLVFVDNPEYVEPAINQAPAAIVTSGELCEQFSSLSDTAVLTAANVRLAHALIKQAYDDHDHRDTGWPQIHPSAVIHESATIAAGVMVGPGVVIGRNAHVGRGSIIKANAVVEQDAVIGEDCLIHPNVVVAHGCKIGNRVILKSGCVIGMEGFGFAQDENGRSHRIPQTGRVTIEDDVVLGANCNVDRATYEETRIRAGAKIDALTQIGHNVDIGEDCIIVASSAIAGSSVLGRGVIMSGQCGVLDHVKVADQTILLHRAGVTSDIEKPGAYAGMPPQPLNEYFKNTAVAHKLVELRKQLRQLEKQVTALSQK